MGSKLMAMTYGQVSNAAAVDRCSRQRTGRGALGWVGRRYGLMIIGGAVIAIIVALALRQHWVAAADLLPLLFTLPCAAMMAMRMRSMTAGRQTDLASSHDQTTAEIGEDKSRGVRDAAPAVDATDVTT
jgi:hypothetical protein